MSSGRLDPRHVLLGRRNECDTLDRLLTSVRAGQSQVLLVRGEAGVGKSALLEYLVERASECRVARASGNEYEMELAYAGLHQLCVPVLDLRERLPGPQRDALESAFGLRADPAPDRFVVGLGVLSLLSEVAEEQPLVWVVDDAQWLDKASALSLAFVARRLLAESVGLVFAVREPSNLRELAGLPELMVEGLDDDDARALLDSALPGRLDEQVRDRVVAESRGNPLALLELPRGLSAGRARGRIWTTRRDPAGEPDRAELPPEARVAPCRDPTTAADGSGRARGRGDFAVARGRPARTRRRRCTYRRSPRG